MVVIIPYKNNPIDLGILLTQLQQQRQKPKAIYIADNSENGEALKIATRYQFSVPISVQLKVGPIHKSWNAGIKFAKDEDVAILNDDVLIPWDFIDTFTEYAKSDGAQMYCPANPGFPPLRKIRKGYEWYSKSELNYYLLDHQQYKLPPSIAGWCMVIPNKTIKKIGMFDEQFKLYFGDKDYEARIFKKGGKVCFIKGLWVQHYGSTSTFKIEKKQHEDIYKRDEERYKKKWNIA